MRTVIQRVKHASVAVEGKISGSIEKGLLLLIGFEEEDTAEDLEWSARKIGNMRIFDDVEGVMNLSVKDAQGSVLSISQFTLMASTKKGNRPSYINAAKPDLAIKLYADFNKILSLELGKKIEEGIFGADMQVELLNDGPVTILLDSKNKQ